MSTPPPQGQNPYAQQPTTPYGQQPQGGNPFGQQQPGVPPQQQPPYFNQGGPIPQAPVGQQTGSGKAKKILRIVIPVAVIAIVAVTWFANRDGASSASVGDCMHRGSASATDPDLKVVDCSDAKAQYKVLAKIKGDFSRTEASAKCTEAVKDAFQYTYTQTNSGSSFLLCIAEYKK
ncbi:hypothetical protein [Streptomyces sp. NPDC050738]|uniref:LppU/SCO3897 family protein n=1 Tax=Streptomyces sp. NPDC050738 TaxID=3154744 RepID=UPI003417FE70